MNENFFGSVDVCMSTQTFTRSTKKKLFLVSLITGFGREWVKIKSNVDELCVSWQISNTHSRKHCRIGIALSLSIYSTFCSQIAECVRKCSNQYKNQSILFWPFKLRGFHFHCDFYATRLFSSKLTIEKKHSKRPFKLDSMHIICRYTVYVEYTHVRIWWDVYNVCMICMKSLVSHPSVWLCASECEYEYIYMYNAYVQLARCI